jgi:hypothetical protein
VFPVAAARVPGGAAPRVFPVAAARVPDAPRRACFGWVVAELATDPLGQHRPPGLRQASSIGGNYPVGLSRIRRIGNRPILERQAELTVKVSGRRVDARNHDTGGRSGDRRRRRTCQD